MGWKILNIESDCLLNSYLNSLVITYPDGNKGRILMTDIDVLLIENNRIRLTVDLINKLTKNNVCLILCDELHKPSTYCLNYCGNSESYRVFNSQLNWTEEYKDKTWNWLVRNKINNQLRFLKENGYDITDWNDLINNNDVNFKKINFESQVANLFFHQIFGNEFNRKDDNFYNSLFDYGYTVLTSMVCRSIVSKGLNQHISFFHGSTYSEFPLAYDIVEIFRSVVDFFVIQIKENNIKGLDTKTWKRLLLDYISNVKVVIDKKRQSLTNAIDSVVDWIVNKNYESHSIDTTTLLIENLTGFTDDE